MVKTAVGLFKNADVAEEVVRDLESKGFPRMELRTLDEPLDFGSRGAMSIPRIDFEVQVFRELKRIGATQQEAQAYVDGLRRGGALVFATDSDEKAVDAAAGIMNQHGALEVEETRGAEPELPDAERERPVARRDSSVLGGRMQQPGGAARYFVW